MPARILSTLFSPAYPVTRFYRIIYPQLRYASTRFSGIPAFEELRARKPSEKNLKIVDRIVDNSYTRPWLDPTPKASFISRVTVRFYKRPGLGDMAFSEPLMFNDIVATFYCNLSKLSTFFGPRLGRWLAHRGFKLTSKSPYVATRCGELAESLGDILEAEAFYRIALATNPDAKEATKLRADLIKSVDRSDNAALARAYSTVKAWRSMEAPGNKPYQKFVDEFQAHHAYHTVAIEGSRVTLHDTRRILAGEKNVGSAVEVGEILGVDQALSLLFDMSSKATEIEVQEILELHQLVLGSVEPSIAGATRINNGVYSDEVSYGLNLGTPAERVKGEMVELVDWINANDGVIEPTELAALAHIHFIRIHPFLDGNGRTGRLLSNLILMKAGLPPAIVIFEQRYRYYKSLDMAFLGSARPLCRFLAACMEGTLKVYFTAYDAPEMQKPS